MTFTFRALAMTGAALLVTACGSNDNVAPPTANDTLVAPGNPAGPAVAADAVALGLTERQLLDADFKDWSGIDLGDVEALERDSGGAVTHLVVEISDTDPDRFVRVPIDGLERVADGNDWDVRGQYSREQLMALPAIQR